MLPIPVSKTAGSFTRFHLNFWKSLLPSCISYYKRKMQLIVLFRIFLYVFCILGKEGVETWKSGQDVLMPCQTKTSLLWCGTRKGNYPTAKLLGKPMTKGICFMTGTSKRFAERQNTLPSIVSGCTYQIILSQNNKQGVGFFQPLVTWNMLTHKVVLFPEKSN